MSQDTNNTNSNNNKKTVILLVTVLIIITVIAVIALFFAFASRSQLNDLEEGFDSLSQRIDLVEDQNNSGENRDGLYDGDNSNNGDQSNQNGDQSPDSDNEGEEEITVMVYFSYIGEEGNSNDNPEFTMPVMRQTTRPDVAAFALTQLLSGPTPSEQDQGYFTPLELSGESNCNGNDFRFNVEGESIRIQFCRTVVSGGVLQDARIKETITESLDQFSNIAEDEVILLTKEGDCFGDQSGRNLCLSE